MTAPDIRPMQPADLEAILAIAAASPEAPHWQPSDYAPYVVAAEPPLLRTAFVAVASGSIVGFAAASLLLDPPGTTNSENHCELDSMAVHPDARCRGLGSVLLQEILRWAATHGCRRFTLEVRASNTAAIRLYQRHGLRREGLRPRYYADSLDDAVLMGIRYPRDQDWALFSTAKPG